MNDKNTMLKVASIFVIIGACCLILLCLLLSGVSDIIMEVIDDALIESGVQLTPDDAEILDMILPILGWVLICVGVCRLIVGIIGVKQKNAVTCIVFGAIITFLRVSSLLSSGFTSGWGSAVIAVLYLIGAIKLNKERKAKEAAAVADYYENV